MRQCLTLLIGIVVLLSTTGLPRVQHLCGGIVQSVGLWVGNAGCNHDAAPLQSCTSNASADQGSEVPADFCCKKPTADEASKKKDCCTDQVEWEPSQNDLAFSDQLILEAQGSFITPILTGTLSLLPRGTEMRPYVRPPPRASIPQGRRRALLQVYRC
ncbi:MAG: hypothetical protein AB8F78_17370 [Saprospiraceae bacterium]